EQRVARSLLPVHQSAEVVRTAETVAFHPAGHEGLHFADDLCAVHQQRTAQLYRACPDEHGLDRIGTAVHARGYGKVHGGNFGRNYVHVAQGPVQFGWGTEPAGRNVRHVFDVDIGLEEPVVQHGAPRPPAVGSLYHVENVRETHAELHRNGNLHRLRDGFDDAEIAGLNFVRSLRFVVGHEENVEFESVGPGIRYPPRIFYPLAPAHTVDACDDRYARLPLGFGYE